MGFDFALVDVFTDRPFGGNQLAVFPDAAGIPDAVMQQLAREFNFSETTFVLPPRDPSHSFRVRIFTPHRELPFAGHPTLGTAAVLASPAAEHQRFVFEEGIGPVTVTVDGPTIQLHLYSPRYESTEETPPVGAIARALTLPEDDIAETWCAGAGLPFCFVRLTDTDAVDRAVLDKTAWKAGIAGGWATELYLFARDSASDATRFYARLFAPGVGVDEDPATGSACASLVASVAQRSPEPDGEYRIHVDQGVAMGRPSVLEGIAHKQNGQLTEVVVGGRAIVIGHGTITLPAGSNLSS